jgi:hypothetical protein
VHLLVSFFSRFSHITTADQETSHENEATTSGSSVYNPLREEWFFAETKFGSCTIFSGLDKKIGSARIGNV